MSWGTTPAQSGHGLVIRYSEPGQPEGVFVLPIIAWRTDEQGFGEAIVATKDTIETESELGNVRNWTILGYHLPPFIPHPDVAP